MSTDNARLNDSMERHTQTAGDLFGDGSPPNFEGLGMLSLRELRLATSNLHDNSTDITLGSPRIEEACHLFNVPWLSVGKPLWNGLKKAYELSSNCDQHKLANGAVEYTVKGTHPPQI